LGRDKTNPIARYNLAVLQQRKGDYDEALENLKTYLKASKSKSKDTEEAFALIERIKELQARKGGSITDDEIHALAKDVETNQKRSANANESAPLKKAESVPEENADPEVDALEKALID
jgi:hypothetical protein